MAGDSDAAVVLDVLNDYGSLVSQQVQSYLVAQEQGEASDLYALARDYPQRGGRSLRSCLCIAAACACGASVQDAIQSAVAIELLHNSFLIHDDIEDLSEQRRGRPTLHLLHGVPVAMNVGHALSVLSLRPLIENQLRVGLVNTLKILEQVEWMARQTVEGQALELGWRRHNSMDVTEADYLRMVLKKTCWYTTILPLRVGVLLGRAPDISSDGILSFGFFLGAAFQIIDDLLNLIGDAQKYGKELEGDLWEGKRTLIVIHLLQCADASDRRRASEFLALSRFDKTEEQVRWMRAAIEHYGCIEYARRVAHGLAGAARHEFDRVFQLPESRDLAFIRGLSEWVIRRA